MSLSTALEHLLPSHSWQQDAVCRDVDPALFFSTSAEDRGAALAMCAACPVRPRCLEHALATGEPHGIWGGADEYERRRLLHRHRRGI